MSESNMKPDAVDEEMLPEYDLTGGVRGKYYDATGRARMWSFSTQMSPRNFPPRNP